MRTRLAMLFAVVALATTAHAQVMRQVNLTSATCVAGGASGCFEQTIDGNGSIGIQITGTYTATIQFEQTVDGSTWVAWSVQPSAGGATVTSTTGTGIWFGNVTGVRAIRVRVSAYTSGTATVSTVETQTRLGPISPLNPVFPSVGLADGSVGAPSLYFASESNTGMYHRGGNTITFTLLAGNFLDLNNANGYLEVGSGTKFAWSTTSDASAARDLVLRRSAAKILTLDTDGAGGAITQLNVKGQILGQSSIGINNGFILQATADKQVQFVDSTGATGAELVYGTPTLGTCTGGSIVSGSHNHAGSYTGNTSGSCVINFGTPNWTNTPFCFAMSTASTTHPRISAASTSSITVTGGVSGEQINFHCEGRIGT